MKNNLIVILCFTAGIFCGTFANTTISTYCEKLPQFLLYALVIQVGLNLGANAELGKMIKDIRFSSLLLPFFTIIGCRKRIRLLFLILLAYRTTERGVGRDRDRFATWGYRVIG